LLYNLYYVKYGVQNVEKIGQKKLSTPLVYMDYFSYL